MHGPATIGRSSSGRSAGSRGEDHFFALRDYVLGDEPRDPARIDINELPDDDVRMAGEDTERSELFVREIT